MISEETSELSGVSVNHSKVERSEVLVEWEVSQIVVDIEEECVLEILWRSEVTNPIELICIKID